MTNFRTELWGYERDQVDRYVADLEQRVEHASGDERDADRVGDAGETVADAEDRAADLLLAARRRVGELEQRARERAAETEALADRRLAEADEERQRARRESTAEAERNRAALEVEIGELRTLRDRWCQELRRIAGELDRVMSDDRDADQPTVPGQYRSGSV